MLCESCGQILPSDYHSKKCKQEMVFSCNICRKIFKTHKTLIQHQKLHSNTSFLCSICGQILKTQTNLNVHFKKVQAG